MDFKDKIKQSNEEYDIYNINKAEIKHLPYSLRVLFENYIRNNCHIIKTHNIDWSEGSMNLVQAKLLDPDDEPIEKLAFPFSVMLHYAGLVPEEADG